MVDKLKVIIVILFVPEELEVGKKIAKNMKLVFWI